jgi:hypothetical protein
MGLLLLIIHKFFFRIIIFKLFIYLFKLLFLIN